MAYMDNNFIASDEFLKTYEWRKLRQVAQLTSMIGQLNKTMKGKKS